MTYREKLKQDHPEWGDDEVSKYIDFNCPYDGCPCAFNVSYTYRDCDRCWDQEFPETTSEKEEFHEEILPQSNGISCDTCIHNEVCKYRDDFTKAIELAKDVPHHFEVIIRCKHNL